MRKSEVGVEMETAADVAAEGTEAGKSPGAQPGNANTAFWEKPGVKAAQKLIDLWASQRRHMAEGCEGVIRADKVFENPPQTFEVFERGLRWVYEEYSRSYSGLTIRVQDFPKTMFGMLMVDAVMMQLDLSPHRGPGVVSVCENLLLWLYPRTGPYQVDAHHTHRLFNPPGFLGELGGKYLDRSKEFFLRQIERDFLSNLMEAGRDPKRFFGEAEKDRLVLSVVRVSQVGLPLYGEATQRELDMAASLRRQAQGTTDGQ